MNSFVRKKIESTMRMNKCELQEPTLHVHHKDFLILAVFLCLVLLGIISALTVCAYENAAVFKFISVPTFGLSYMLLIHLILVKHNFYIINYRGSLPVLLFLDSVLAYGYSYAWAYMYMRRWISGQNFIFLLLPVQVCLLHVIILNCIYRDHLLF